MRHLARLRGHVQSYDWGSRSAIARLQGRPVPSPTPEAELWLGGHPRLPADVEVAPGRWTPLDRLTREAPEDVLGAELAATWDGTFPFLFKVLAAGRPLSVQAHPDRATARERFARQETDPTLPRRFTDPQAKPEILLALETFRMLRGLREPEELSAAAALFTDADAWRRRVVEPAGRGPSELCRAWLAMPADEVDGLVRGLPKSDDPDEPATWIGRLAALHPGDPAILAPLVLRLRTLAPGETAFTPPGVLHAYLEGTGIELMVSSDNVVRGGLTSKTVDRELLAEILRPAALADAEDLEDAPGQRRILFPDGQLLLHDLQVEPERPVPRRSLRSVAVVLCLEGEGEVREGERGLGAVSGDAFLVPAAAGPVELRGRGRWIAAVAGPSLAAEGHRTGPDQPAAR